MIRIVAFTVAVAGAIPCWGAEVVLLESAKVGSGLVRLGDVARVTGEDAYALQRLPLMPPPPPGASRRLPAGAVRDMLRAQGVELANVAFRGAYHVNITAESERPARTTASALRTAPPASTARTGFRVRPGAGVLRAAPAGGRMRRRRASTLSAVEDRIMSLLQAELDNRPTAGLEPNRLAVKSLEMTQTASDELRQFEASLLRAQFNGAGPDAPGRFGSSAWPEPRGIDEAFRVVAEVIELPTRVVATQPIARGSTVTRSSLRLEVVPLAELDRPAAAGFSQLDEAIGKQATRQIRTKDVLSDLNTAPPLMVRKGDDVTVVAAGGGIRVTLSAVALGEGRLRDMVEVEAYEGDQRFTARVIGDRQLAVVVPGAETGGATRVGGIR